MKKRNNKKHLVIIGVLTILLFVILITSTTFQNSSIEYNYETEIVSNSFNGQVKLGTTKITNNGFMPVKVGLKNLKACIFNSNYDNSYDLYVSYSKADRSYINNGYRSSHELGSYEEEDLGIYLDSLPYPSDYKFDTSLENFSGTEFEIKLFEVEENTYYGFCRDAIADESFHTINVKVEKNE